MAVALHNGSGPLPQPRGNLLRELKPADWRAFLAADLAEDGLTLAQACAVSGASIGYLATLRRLTTNERQAVLEGRASLASFHTRKRAQREQEQEQAEREIEAARQLHAEWEAYQREQAAPDHGKHFAIGGGPTLSDSVVENIVREVVWRAVDRITSPELPLVAAE